jgi:DNA uptake protein ComE-like DNA-binding protein
MVAASVPPSPPPSRLHAEQAALAAFLVLALGLLFAHSLTSLRGSCRPVELHESLTLDLNEAPRAALLQVPGIGAGAAERIEEQRNRAAFQSVDDLTRVSGIKKATLDKVRPWLSVRGDGAAEPPPAVAIPVKKTGLSKKEAAWTGPPLDVNEAPLQELLRIPLVGPKTAQKIVEERQKARFEKVEDLRRVVGAKTLERIRPYVRVGPATILASVEP